MQLINNIMENLTDIFLKSRGHKYLRKVPNGKGGYRYIYEEPSLKTTSVVTREQKYKVLIYISTLEILPSSEGFLFNYT